MTDGIKTLDVELIKKLKESGITDDEIKMIEAWRFISWGSIRCFKKDNVMSGRIEITSTH